MNHDVWTQVSGGDASSCSGAGARRWLVVLTGITGTVLGCGGPGSSDKPGDGGGIEVVSQAVTKAVDPTANGDTDFCNAPSARCDAGEGDCDSDAQCLDGLICGTNNGPKFDMGTTYDVCVPATCTNGLLDPEETTVDCGGDCGNHGPACEAPPACPDNGQVSTCAATCRCAAGWGDCDSDAQCLDGLICGTNNGPKFGMGATYDVCVPITCTNGLLDPEETTVDCGGDCGDQGPACGEPPDCPDNGQVSTCTATCRCAAGWGDCDSDAQCLDGLICGTNNGPKFGMEATYDVCVPITCTNGLLDAGETTVDCGGDCGSLCACTPTEEVCDGLDNDCDGVVDDGDPGAGALCSTGQQGVCATGTTACTAGALVCVPGVAPTEEVCDGADNDCDGVVDDGNPGAGALCSTGQQGVCATGTTACTAGALVCVPGVAPTEEVCDGADNDCDGVADEMGTSCDSGVPGVCAAGTLTCVGSDLTCIPNIPSSPELCDDLLDNDCDGFVDEECDAAYSPSSEYLIDPDLAIDVLRSLADFRALSRDDVNGGFFSYVNVDGSVGSNHTKGFVTTSRDAWTFSRAFMVSGDEIYLDHAAHALEHLFSHGWDSTYGGWYFSGNELGTPNSINGSKSAFVQHYALLGIGAYCDATRDATACEWFQDGRSTLDTSMWDSDPARLGYYDQVNRNLSNPRNKGFTATVDALTTNAIQAELLWPATYHQRMVDLANIAVDRLAANMDLSIVEFGFPELYDSSWNVIPTNTANDVGHVLKSAWVLARAYMRNPDQRFQAAARKLIFEVLDNGGYDHTSGVPYTTANWSTGAQTLMAECWQIEQAITGGLSNWYIAGDENDANTYLEMADRGLQFFTQYVIDHTYGGTWKMNNLDGIPSGNSKSNLYNVEYHSTETFWFTYLYGNLLLHREPVALYYMIPAAETEQTVQLNPVAVDEDSLQIQSVTLDGSPLDTFDGPNREVTLAAGQGGKLRVVFGPAS